MINLLLLPPHAFFSGCFPCLRVFSVVPLRTCDCRSLACPNCLSSRMQGLVACRTPRGVAAPRSTLSMGCVDSWRWEGERGVDIRIWNNSLSKCIGTIHAYRRIINLGSGRVYPDFSSSCNKLSNCFDLAVRSATGLLSWSGFEVLPRRFRT